MNLSNFKTNWQSIKLKKKINRASHTLANQWIIFLGACEMRTHVSTARKRSVCVSSSRGQTFSTSLFTNVCNNHFDMPYYLYTYIYVVGKYCSWKVKLAILFFRSLLMLLKIPTLFGSSAQLRNSFITAIFTTCLSTNWTFFFLIFRLYCCLVWVDFAISKFKATNIGIFWFLCTFTSIHQPKNPSPRLLFTRLM